MYKLIHAIIERSCPIKSGNPIRAADWRKPSMNHHVMLLVLLLWSADFGVDDKFDLEQSNICWFTFTDKTVKILVSRKVEAVDGQRSGHELFYLV